MTKGEREIEREREKAQMKKGRPSPTKRVDGHQVDTATYFLYSQRSLLLYPRLFMPRYPFGYPLILVQQKRRKTKSGFWNVRDHVYPGGVLFSRTHFYGRPILRSLPPDPIEKLIMSPGVWGRSPQPGLFQNTLFRIFSFYIGGGGP